MILCACSQVCYRHFEIFEKVEVEEGGGGIRHFFRHPHFEFFEKSGGGGGGGGSAFLGTPILKKWRCGLEWSGGSKSKVEVWSGVESGSGVEGFFECMEGSIEPSMQNDAVHMRLGLKLRMRVCDKSKDE